MTMGRCETDNRGQKMTAKSIMEMRVNKRRGNGDGIGGIGASSGVLPYLDPHENFWLGDWTEDVQNALKNWTQWYNDESSKCDFRDQELDTVTWPFSEDQPSAQIIRPSEQVKPNAPRKLIGVFQFAKNKKGAAVIKRIV